MATEFKRVSVPSDQDELVDFLCEDDWPFHGCRRPSAADVAGMEFDTADVRSFWMVVDAEVVGLVRLLDLGDIGDGAPQFDLRIASGHRGRGHGAAAVRWLAGDLFTEHQGLHRIEASTRDDNAAMQRALSSAGFVLEGRLRQSWRSDDGRWLDTFVYGLLRSERRLSSDRPASRRDS